MFGFALVCVRRCSCSCLILMLVMVAAAALLWSVFAVIAGFVAVCVRCCRVLVADVSCCGGGGDAVARACCWV